MRQSIRGYADGLVDVLGSAPGASASIASELAAVRAVIEGSEDLRRVLSDPGVELRARRGVLADLFEGRIGESTVQLLNYVLDADRATETVADVEWLAVRFEAAAAGRELVGDTVLGHKAAEERLDGYATAVIRASALDQRALGEVEDELFRFQRVVTGSDDLREALTSRDLPAERRRSLVRDLLASKATPATTTLAGYATRVGRPRDYVDLLEALVERVASEANRRLAEVRSAMELDDEQRSRLAGALSRAVGHEVDVRVTVDPSVVAGFVATIGDTVVDGSVRHQLDLLKERLVMPEVNITTGERH